jgi:hypothetical protein
MVTHQIPSSPCIIFFQFRWLSASASTSFKNRIYAITPSLVDIGMLVHSWHRSLGWSQLASTLSRPDSGHFHPFSYPSVH